MADEKKKIGRQFRGSESSGTLRGRDLALSTPFVRVAGQQVSLDKIASTIRGKLRVSRDDPEATYLEDKLDPLYFDLTPTHKLRTKGLHLDGGHSDGKYTAPQTYADGGASNGTYAVFSIIDCGGSI